MGRRRAPRLEASRGPSFDLPTFGWMGSKAQPRCGRPGACGGGWSPGPPWSRRPSSGFRRRESSVWSGAEGSWSWTTGPARPCSTAPHRGSNWNEVGPGPGRPSAWSVSAPTICGAPRSGSGSTKPATPTWWRWRRRPSSRAQGLPSQSWKRVAPRTWAGVAKSDGWSARRFASNPRGERLEGSGCRRRAPCGPLSCARVGFGRCNDLRSFGTKTFCGWRVQPAGCSSPTGRKARSRRPCVAWPRKDSGDRSRARDPRGPPDLGPGRSRRLPAVRGAGPSRRLPGVRHLAPDLRRPHPANASPPVLPPRRSPRLGAGGEIRTRSRSASRWIGPAPAGLAVGSWSRPSPRARLRPRLPTRPPETGFHHRPSASRRACWTANVNES